MKEITLPNGVLDITKGVIVHQVNCQNKFGAGLAKAIAERYPVAKTKYHHYCTTAARHKLNLLGEFICVPVTNTLNIIHLFSQYNYGNAQRTGIVYTNYDALIPGLRRICEEYDDVYIPKGIGCGLAGGDWNYVQSQIQDLPLTAVALL